MGLATLGMTSQGLPYPFNLKMEEPIQPTSLHEEEEGGVKDSSVYTFLFCFVLIFSLKTFLSSTTTTQFLLQHIRGWRQQSSIVSAT
mmetsp:Transcript_12417/g.19088  ORF Transcript_12417/g.19088 Transcript_12417/m.19088 type:complete len:87 (-) Transcript_12417:139-399(-)